MLRSPQRFQHIGNMGDQRAFNKRKNDFYAYNYTTLSPRVTVGGVTGRMIEKKDGFKTKNPSLPAYRKTSDIYFAPGENGYASQAKLFGANGKMCLDFDWSHTHTNQDGTVFPKGTVHVQEYRVSKIRDPKSGKLIDGFKRVKKARRMTPAEIMKYGPILHHFNPDIKF